MTLLATGIHTVITLLPRIRPPNDLHLDRREFKPWRRSVFLLAGLFGARVLPADVEEGFRVVEV